MYETVNDKLRNVRRYVELGRGGAVGCRDYCKYLYESEHNFDSPEAELLHFLNRTSRQAWRWLDKRSFPSPEHAGQYTVTVHRTLEKIFYF